MCPRQERFPADCHEEEEDAQWMFYDSEQLRGRACPVLLSIQWQRVLQGYAWMKEGVMPVAGGWLAQEEWWLQAFETVEAQVLAVKREARERGRITEDQAEDR